MDSSVCKKSYDNQHVYKKTVAALGSTCIYCGEPEEGRKVLNEIPGNEKVKTLQGAKCPGSPPVTPDMVDGMLMAFEMNGRILAIQARIEGMKARNVVSGISGFSPEYGQSDFQKAGDNITMCVQQLELMRKNI